MSGMLGANKEAYVAREGWGVQLERKLEQPWELGTYSEMRNPWGILNLELTLSDLCHKCSMENYLC